ncbi:MAG: hypothetical protein ABIO80_01335 [Sphingomicrobium sp.]
MPKLLFILSLIGASSPALAQIPVQTSAQTFAEDSGVYAARYDVAAVEALRRIKAQQASVPATDAIAREFEGRLAGIAIEHAPQYRIVVLLTGSAPVAERFAGGVPIVFRTGAQATHAQAITALRQHLIDLRRDLPGARGAGYDQRTGEVVLLVRSEDADRLGVAAIKVRAEQVGGAPVRIVINDLVESNMAVDGGGRAEGDQGGRRQRCTTGFVVTDGSRDGIATAAHCPDELVYRDPVRDNVPLVFAGQWGAGYQDVQVNLSPEANEPHFFANRDAGSLRAVATWRNRASTRAGDFVCHWGESSHYSCAEVLLTDYAPPGELCGGPCEPTWVTVAGPSCVQGDSGGPVFSGNVAFGIAKGINRRPDGRCAFYYYMSTDYLPPPWRLRYDGDRAQAASSSPRR